MPRPSRNIEQALLQSGRALYAERGGARLSVRALVEHAGVNLGMFHYHFKTKDAFLRQLLAGIYEEMFTQLSGQVQQSGPPLQRLREALKVLAGFVRSHAQILGRVLADAAAGDAVAVEFLRANAPRHLGLLLKLMDQAQAEGLLLPMAPLQRFIFLMSAVAMPLLVAPTIASLGVAPDLLGGELETQVLSDAAIAERIELALRALTTEPKGWT
jgi:AcrR family transcriptional regulator